MIMNCNEKYRILTRDKFIEEMLCSDKQIDIDNVLEIWNRLSKGYEFIIIAGKNESTYSVKYFNDNILGGRFSDFIEDKNDSTIYYDGKPLLRTIQYYNKDDFEFNLKRLKKEIKKYFIKSIEGNEENLEIIIEYK